MSEAVSGRPGTENVAAASRDAFARWVDDAPDGRAFGQVIVRPTPTGGYVLRHLDDAQARDLQASDDPRDAREIARLTENGEYRPLKSSPNLRRGWRLNVTDARSLGTAMDYLYPAGVVHWYLHREGRLSLTISGRTQRGRVASTSARSGSPTEGVRDAARACCEDEVCLKKTLWDVDEKTPLGIDRGEGEIPCPEPCSIFVSFARRVRFFEREKERDAAGLSPSEREDLAALVEAAASGEVRFAREAEFEKPLNERRMRYRRLTLVPRLHGDE